MYVLQTERLTLRRFTPDDLDLLYELDHDPAVMHFINGGKPTPRAEIENDQLPGIIAAYDCWPGFGRWAAIETRSGRFLGWFALRVEADAVDTPELGYRLHRHAWGQGFATEGARALVRKAFTESGAQRVWATTMTVNTASRWVMEKAGLRYVRTFFMDWPDVIEGGEHGDVEYALTRIEWQAHQREQLEGIGS